MVHWLSLFAVLVFALPALATSRAVLEETLYYDFQKVIQSKDLQKQKSVSGFSKFEQTLYVDALWDMVEAGSPEALKALSVVQTFHYDLVEKLRLGILKIKYGRAPFLEVSLSNDISNALQAPKVDTKIIYILAAYEEELLASGHSDLISLAKAHPRYTDIADSAERKQELSQDVLADVYYRTPDVANYMNGEYVKSIKLFMYCRDNRLFPCLMIMRDVYGQPVRNADGTLWNQMSLASSAKGIPSYYRNGNTPAGILTIDSVMPAADQQVSFGKFRRLILNFIPKSRGEVLSKSLLPASSHADDWWKTGTVARDAGRNLLRIHGSGKINVDPSTPYYPFMRTSGCIAQRENTYDGIEYRDQRDLLDTVMAAMEMDPVFENEPKAKGILYLMDIDDKEGPVTLSDLASRGIE